MKSKKISRKLVLNKSTVSNLNEPAMGNVHGGTGCSVLQPCIDPSRQVCGSAECVSNDTFAATCADTCERTCTIIPVKTIGLYCSELLCPG